MMKRILELYQKDYASPEMENGEKNNYEDRINHLKFKV